MKLRINNLGYLKSWWFLVVLLASLVLVTTYCRVLHIVTQTQTKIKLQNVFQRKPALDPSRNYVCLTRAGGMGNHIFQYASTFGITRKYNLTILLEEGKDIEKYFKVPSAEVVRNAGAVCKTFKKLKEKKCCEYDTSVTSPTGNRSYVIGDYLQSWKYFRDYFTEVRRELTFNPYILEPARYIVDNLRQSLNKNNESDHVTTVGVHLRLGDMFELSLLSGGFDVAPEGYVHRAVDYFRSHFKNVLFVVCSDGMEYAKKVFMNINVSAEFVHLPPIQDMAVLSSCDHLIMTVGSFGWWAGFLSGGRVVYYKHPMKEGLPGRRNYNYEDYFLPSWIGLE